MLIEYSLLSHALFQVFANALSEYFSHVVFIDDDIFVAPTGLDTLRADAKKFPSAMLCGWGW